jgi:hypothetical protein
MLYACDTCRSLLTALFIGPSTLGTWSPRPLTWSCAWCKSGISLNTCTKTVTQYMHTAEPLFPILLDVHLHNLTNTPPCQFANQFGSLEFAKLVPQKNCAFLNFLEDSHAALVSYRSLLSVLCPLLSALSFSRHQSTLCLLIAPPTSDHLHITCTEP